jgi:hypothetical protein
MLEMTVCELRPTGRNQLGETVGLSAVLAVLAGGVGVGTGVLVVVACCAFSLAR